jgi:hypothetical protein
MRIHPHQLRGALAPVLALLAALVLLPFQAWAWGADGHRLVATVAEGLPTPAAKAEADRLLAQEPGSTLASISTWADEARTPEAAP